VTQAHESAPERGTARVTVRFDQLQYRLLEFLRQEGTFGKQDGEIIANVVRAYLQQRETGDV
jgi:hypothetical protein